jgi:hypothetical protein
MIPPRVLTPTRAAEYLGRTRTEVYRLRDEDPTFPRPDLGLMNPFWPADRPGNPRRYDSRYSTERWRLASMGGRRWQKIRRDVGPSDYALRDGHGHDLTRRFLPSSGPGNPPTGSHTPRP